MANARRLVELSMVPPLAKEVAAQIDAGGGLVIGTTATTAMAGNRVPTATIRGGVIQQPAIADAGTAPTQAQFNALLAALRAAGVIAT